MHRHGSIRVVCETYAAQVLGITPSRPLPVGREGVLRLRPRQLGAVPAVGRRGLRAAAVAVPARPDRGDAPSSTARRSSSAARRSSPTCSGPGCRRTRWAGSGWPPRQGRRSRRALRAVDGAVRHRHHRRHRDDRDAAHLPVQRARRGAAWHHRRRRARLRPQAGGRGDRPGDHRARHARHPVRARRSPPRPATGPATTRPGWSSRASGCAPATPTSGRRRLLRVPGPDRRHDQGAAASGSPRPRSRPGCWRTRRSPRPSWSPPPTPTGWRSPSPTSCSRPRRGSRRGGAHRVLPGGTALVQAAARVVFIDALPDHRDR